MFINDYCYFNVGKKTALLNKKTIKLYFHFRYLGAYK